MLKAKETKHNRVNYLHHCIYSTNMHILYRPFYFSNRALVKDVKIICKTEM